jgi:hypothetical protein
MRTRGEQVCWGLVAVVVGVWLALVEVFWLPLRVAGVLVPLSIVVAVVANLLLPAAALRYSGSRLIAVLPVLTWLGVAFAAMVRRPEGDLVMSGVGALGVVSLAFLMLGVLAAAFSVGRVLGGARRTRVRTEVVPDADRTGRGTDGAR